MEFSSLTPEKMKELRPLFEGAPSNTCDYTPGGLLIWAAYYQTELCREGDALFLRIIGEEGEPLYLYPIAKDQRAALLKLPRPLKLCAVPEEALPAILEFSPKARITYQEAHSDYLYRAEDLLALQGKKYATQRNHISRFQREYPAWSFQVIGVENRAAVKDFYQKFLALYPPEGAEAEAERDAIFALLESPDLWGMEGGMLMVEEQPVGFSIGERQGDTLFVHIEKADRAYKGVYQMLTNQYARAFAKDLQFINREDDMGDEGLRKAKLAYHPCALLKKHLIEIE